MSKCLETFDYAFQLYPSPRAKAMETKLISSDNKQNYSANKEI